MGNTQTYSRKATYAGKLYNDDEDALTEELQEHLTAARQQKLPTTGYTEDRPEDEVHLYDSPIRMLLSPHSADSSAVAAHAYQYLNPVSLRNIRSILILHPHHCKVDYANGKCLVSNAHVLETPLGDLPVADDLRQEILALSMPAVRSASSSLQCINPNANFAAGSTSSNDSPPFMLMEQQVDEQEQSGEMQYPWIAHCLALSHRTDICVLPVLVGTLSTREEIQLGTRLAPILQHPHVLTIIASEFCTWGAQYQYTPWDRRSGYDLQSFIHAVDRDAMATIEGVDAAAFGAYRLHSRNPISGRHAIALWLHAMQQQTGRTSPRRKEKEGRGEDAWTESTSNKDDLDVKFVVYAQSQMCQTLHDSCVGLAAGVATSRTS